MFQSLFLHSNFPILPVDFGGGSLYLLSSPFGIANREPLLENALRQGQLGLRLR